MTKKIAVIIPRLPSVGGAEVCLRDFIRRAQSKSEIALFEVIPNRTAILKSLRQCFAAIMTLVRLEKGDTALYFFWSVTPLMLIPSRARKLYFVNSSVSPGWFRSLGQKLAVRFADDVIADSPLVQTILLERYPKQKQKISTIPFIPDIDLPDKEAPSRPPTPIRLIYLGRWSPIKGIGHILSVAQAAATFNDRFKVTVITDRDVEQDAALLTSYNVEICIDPARVDIFKSLAETHFLLMLSDYEGLGMASYEAMLLGVIPISWGQGYFNNKFCEACPELKLNQEVFDPQSLLKTCGSVIDDGRFEHYSEISYAISSGYKPFSEGLVSFLEGQVPS